jgi:ribosome maturation factor RimP
VGLRLRFEAGDAAEAVVQERSKTALELELVRLLGPVVEACGLELVDLALRGGGTKVLRLDVDRAGPQGVGVDDCQRVSRAIDAALDESDPIASHYVLEVSSPGVERPIRTPDDFRRNTGRRIVVTTRAPIDGASSHVGLLLGHDGGELLLQEEGERKVRIPLTDVVRALQAVEI